MGTLVRYLAVCFLTLTVVIVGVTVEFGGRTLYGRIVDYRAQGPSLWSQVVDEAKGAWSSVKAKNRPRRSREAKKSAVIVEVEKPKTARPEPVAQRRVTRLAQGDRRVNPTKKPRSAGATKKSKTKVDERISDQDKKALDDLLTSRIAR